MNSTQAKKIKLTDIMSMLGHEVKAIERGGTEYKYISPFRAEKEPSFNVNLPMNSWYDFGLSSGGNSLDFALKYCSNNGLTGGVSGALSWLSKLQGRGGVKTQYKKVPIIASPKEESKLELLKVSPVESKLIVSYLENERKIDPKLIPEYLKQVRYKNHNTDKTYFAYGIENLSGGYEIRVASDKYSFKSAINGRDVSLLSGLNSSRKIVNIFEGTTDFLSLLTMMKTNRLAGDALVMHSLSSYNRTLEVIKEKDYQSINLFLDNNKAGKTHTTAFIRDLGEDKTTSYSNLFLPYMDINEALKASQIPKMLQRG